MSTQFVLVHGGWHAGWAWRPVRAVLEAAGHRVSTPTLPGFGSDDDPTNVTLSDCVEGLVQHVNGRDLQEVVLVGHSWGGIVTGGAAPAILGRLRQLVFVSAYLPRPGQSMLDLLPAERAAAYSRLAEDSPTRSVLPSLSAFQERFMNDVPAHSSAMIHGLLQPQPWRTWADALADDMDFRTLDIPRTYLVPDDDIAAGADAHSWTSRYAQAFDGAVARCAGGHEALLPQPLAMAEALMAAAGRTQRQPGR